MPVPLAMPISARHTAGCSGSANAGTWGEIVVSFLVDKTKTLFLKFQVFFAFGVGPEELVLKIMPSAQFECVSTTQSTKWLLPSYISARSG